MDIERPFFSVPAGDGGLKSYRNAAAQKGIDLYRQIDRRTRAKTVFATSGVPGSVGSGACSLWQELGALLEGSRSFRVWPFEGELPVLLQSAAVVLGEMYPRAAYATALFDGPATSRPPLIVAKTKAETRRAAIEALRTAEWVRAQGVSIDNLYEAEANEDDFDACMTAAALLRCAVERTPLCPPRLAVDRAEGRILGTGSVNLDLAARTFGVRTDRSAVRRRRPAALADYGAISHTIRAFRCPIPGCDKVYTRTRGGWDAHVGSPRSHPEWRPELASAEERKRQFQIEFPYFFR